MTAKTTMEMPAADDLADLDAADIAALTLALEQALAGADSLYRAEQLRDMVENGEHGWREVAESACYSQQMRRLRLASWQKPPCWLDEAEIEAILRAGPAPASDGSGADVSNCPGARLFKRMVSHGVSPFHPDPLSAIEAAKTKGPAQT
jgi:hypothetical protein